jgi:hypothetical protein
MTADLHRARTMKKANPILDGRWGDHVAQSDGASGGTRANAGLLKALCVDQPNLRGPTTHSRGGARQACSARSERGRPIGDTVGLQAQLVAHSEAWKDFDIRRHARRDYTPSLPRWCHAIHTVACPRNKLNQGLARAPVIGLYPRSRGARTFFGEAVRKTPQNLAW